MLPAEGTSGLLVENVANTIKLHWRRAVFLELEAGIPSVFVFLRSDRETVGIRKNETFLSRSVILEK